MQNVGTVIPFNGVNGVGKTVDIITISRREEEINRYVINASWTVVPMGSFPRSYPLAVADLSTKLTMVGV